MNDLRPPAIGVIMGSESDWPTMQRGVAVLKRYRVSYEARVVSAHRTPQLLYSYTEEVSKRGIKVIIAGAGGAAHLPGMTAALCLLPVIGVPILTAKLSGVDSLLSIVQMPIGTPVATVGIGCSENAALLALQILSLNDSRIAEQMAAERTALAQKIDSSKLSDPRDGDS